MISNSATVWLIIGTIVIIAVVKYIEFVAHNISTEKPGANPDRYISNEGMLAIKYTDRMTIAVDTGDVDSALVILSEWVADRRVAKYDNPAALNHINRLTFAFVTPDYNAVRPVSALVYSAVENDDGIYWQTAASGFITAILFEVDRIDLCKD